MNTYNVITCNYVKMYDTLLRLSMQVLYTFSQKKKKKQMLYASILIIVPSVDRDVSYACINISHHLNYGH